MTCVHARRLSERPRTVCTIVTRARQCGLVRMRHVGHQWSNVATICAGQGRGWPDTWTFLAEIVQVPAPSREAGTPHHVPGPAVARSPAHEGQPRRTRDRHRSATVGPMRAPFDHPHRTHAATVCDDSPRPALQRLAALRLDEHRPFNGRSCRPRGDQLRVRRPINGGAQLTPVPGGWS